MSASAQGFFKLVPKRSAVVFFAAVFFTFAPIGMLLVSAPIQERPLSSLLALALVSGMLAISWAATFTVSRWFAVGIVVFSMGMWLLNAPLARTPIGIQSAQPSLEGFSTVVAIVSGYVLFILFISGQGKQTLRLQTEMELARGIHETLVPPLDKQTRRLELLGQSLASSEMGGDLVDVVAGENRTDLYLADVSGHGVKAGVVMGMLKAAIRTSGDTNRPLAELLADLNRVLEETTSAELYATMAVLRVDEDGPGVEYALAGHHPVVCVRADGEVESWTASGTPLGMIAGSRYETQQAQLEPGDTLLLYTDGFNEAADSRDEELGHQALIDAVLAEPSAALERIRDILFDCASAHGPQNDDRTMLLVRAR